MPSIVQMIQQAAASAGIDPDLAVRVAIQESGLNQNARGSKGEIGIFQLLPATAQALGVDPTDLAQNIEGGVSYLAEMLNEFGNPAQALAAYNWGPGKVAAATAAFGSSWYSHLPASVQRYVAAILGSTGASSAAPPAAATQDLAQATLSPNVILIGLGIVLGIVLLFG